MALLKEAYLNLADHGVEVDRPDIVQEHSEINSRTEVLGWLEDKETVEAATYSGEVDRLDVYAPVAAHNAIMELGDEEFEIVSDLYDRHGGVIKQKLGITDPDPENNLVDWIKLTKIMYLAAKNSSRIEEDLKEKLENHLNRNKLFSVEHELVHASHFQELLEEEVEPLDEDFRRYIEDVKFINQQAQDLERKKREGYGNFSDLKMAAAMNFINEESLEKIVRLAGREHGKWVNRMINLMDLEDSDPEFMDELDAEESIAYDILEKDFRRHGPDEDPDDVQGFLEERAEKEEFYQTLIDSGLTHEEIKEALEEANEINEEPPEKSRKAREYRDRTEDLLEEAILREAELQGDFEQFLEPYRIRHERSKELPEDFTEAFAQFWSAYRKGWLEDDRDRIFEELQCYDIESLDETMEDLLHMYDSLEGSTEERVTEIMSSQFDYLANNYDVEI